MNNLILSVATILLFLCIFSTTTIATDTAVFDTDGHPLQAGANYYILPALRGQGGGLTMDSKNSTIICPLTYVIQENLQLSNGLPIKFFPENPSDKTITLSSDLNFVFDASTICVQSTVWSLIIDDEAGRQYVGIGGEIGNPGRETISNWFKIEKAGSGEFDYKIVYCPGVCDICRPICGEVGVFVEEDGRRLLGLTRDDRPLLVRFKKSLEVHIESL